MTHTIVVCTQCSIALRVRTSQLVEALAGDHHVCPEHAAPSPLLFVPEHEVEFDPTKVPTIAPDELLRWVYGMGLPNERPMSEIDEVLRGEIKGVTFLERNPWPVVDYFEMADGTRVYFAIAARGACIYRVARPTRHTEQSP